MIDTNVEFVVVSTPETVGQKELLEYIQLCIEEYQGC